MGCRTLKDGSGEEGKSCCRRIYMAVNHFKPHMRRAIPVVDTVPAATNLKVSLARENVVDVALEEVMASELLKYMY